jgi:hypothetical protein
MPAGASESVSKKVPAPTRVGIVGRLIGSADSWSGIPEGLASGLRDIGYAPFFVSAEPSARTDRLFQSWLRLTGRMDPSWAQTPEMMMLRRWLVSMRRIRTKPATEAEHWVQMGSEFGHPVDNFVTFEDMTVASAVSLADYVELRPAVASAWIRRQKAIYARARACCVSSYWAAGSVREYGVDTQKIHVVGFGCNIKVEAPERDWSVPRFLFIGLDWKRKNGDAVVETFDRLREEHPGARLDLVGSHPNLDLEGVTCHGHLRLDEPRERSRLERLLQESTCLVVPSTYEPFGIVYAEAGSAGLPSIGTRIGGAPDAIGAGGVVVDPFDRGELLKAMRALSRPEVAQDLGDKAQSRSLLLTWEVVARRVALVLGLTGSVGEPDLPPGRPIDAATL